MAEEDDRVGGYFEEGVKNLVYFKAFLRAENKLLTKAIDKATDASTEVSGNIVEALGRTSKASGKTANTANILSFVLVSLKRCPAPFLRQQKKGLHYCNPFLYLAPPAGLEPATQ